MLATDPLTNSMKREERSHDLSQRNNTVGTFKWKKRRIAPERGGALPEFIISVHASLCRPEIIASEEGFPTRSANRLKLVRRMTVSTDTAFKMCKESFHGAAL
jgi:hypothetical protein